MAELSLDRDERLALKAQAHHLDPVVLLGAAGLSDAVMREIDRALTAHGLIKVRVPGDDRDEREAMFARIADTLGAARVAGIGKLLVLYRPVPEQDEPAPPPRERPSPRRATGAPSRAAQGRPAKPAAKRAGAKGSATKGGQARTGRPATERPKGARPAGTGRPVRRS